MDEMVIKCGTPEYKKPETLKAIEILLGIHADDNEEKAMLKTQSPLMASSVKGAFEGTRDVAGNESEIVTKARELKAKLDLLLEEKGATK